MASFYRAYAFELIQLTFFFLHLATVINNDKRDTSILSYATLMYLLPQILLLLRNKSSKGISLVFFCVRQAILITQFKERVEANKKVPIKFWVFFTIAMILFLNSIIVMLIIKYSKRRKIMYTELTFGISLIVLAIYFPKILSQQKDWIQIVSVLFQVGMIAIDGSHNICYSVFAPKILESVWRNNRIDYNGYQSLFFIGILAYKSVVRGEYNKLVDAEEEELEDDNKIKED